VLLPEIESPRRRNKFLRNLIMTVISVAPAA